MKSEKRELVFKTIDFWGRAVFEDKNQNYFGCLDFLPNTKDELDSIKESDLCYFGREIDGDPMGTSIDPSKIIIVEQFKTEENE